MTRRPGRGVMHNRKKGISIVPKLLSTRKTVMGALLGAGLLGGGVAFAYPVGTPLTVSATASPDGGNISVMVTVTNANPSCNTQIEIDGNVVGTLPANGSTTQTATYPLPGSTTGRHKVSARTENCAKGQKEHDHSRFVISNAMVTGPATGSAGDTYRADFTGFAPGTSVTVTATLAGSSPLVQVSDDDVANSKGDGKVHFKFPKGHPGTYTITTAVSPAGPTAAPYTVTVS